jgi:hypothetical protein
LSAAANDVMMQIGSRHDVIRWLFLAPQSFVRGLGMKGLKASCRREAEVFSASQPAGHRELSPCACPFATSAASLTMLRPPTFQYPDLNSPTPQLARRLYYRLFHYLVSPAPSPPSPLAPRLPNSLTTYAHTPFPQPATL